MSKRCQKEIKKLLNNLGDNCDVNIAENNQNGALDSVVGSSNVLRWNELKKQFNCKTNQDFCSILLDLAENHLDRRDYNDLHENVNDVQPQSEQRVNVSKKKRTKEVKEVSDAHTSNAETNFNAKQVPTNFNVYDINSLISDAIKVDKNVENPVDGKSKQTNFFNNEHFSDNVLKSTTVNNIQVKNDAPAKELKITKSKKSVREKQNKKVKNVGNKTEKSKRNVEFDIRKAPEFKVQVENCLGKEEMLVKLEENRVSKIKSCVPCGMQHVQDLCPLQNPHYVFCDSLIYEEWRKKYEHFFDAQDKDVNFEIDDENYKNTYAYNSVPWNLCLKESDGNYNVFCKNEVKEYSQFGPLIGKSIKEVDIPEDFSMKDLWEVYTENGQVYVNTESLLESNWCRFVRPAPTREERNVAAVCKNEKLYFVTVRYLQPGEELLYWQDCVFNTNKKKLEKTTCGGCNMTFAHPLYYRTHCSVFHDIRYSLTIRKYHCKICGAAVLGKENIMKHAAELHNGRGAYQCQFCKKFFLRLNYLEMHRTYGCSANPHRSRPLCDFCGRKFCQPQKLKVHIKRMHSDMSEVLKEFQCKSCFKLLGSRAALARHVKEVHHKQVEGACSCIKCGKYFQNKSNLKIHMLTHSGIKPFRCAQENCNAAFTTKQCLQFHYKKVHGFSEDLMPKIKRSVDYTFEAYSGADDPPHPNNDLQINDQISSDLPSVQSDSQNKSLDVEDSSDIDENSLDMKNIDDPPSLHSPISISMEQSSHSVSSPPSLEPYSGSIELPTTKVVSKGSKKWIGDDIMQPKKTDIYNLDIHKNGRIEETSNISVEVEDTQSYDRTKLKATLNAFTHHESNASLLVEAALDSVCSETNIDMDVANSGNCADALVNNLYTLSHSDALPDVSYNQSDSRDINLISPSVNDHISVTDDLNEDLRHSQNVDYVFHQENFSPNGSPNLQDRNNFIRDYCININASQGLQNYGVNQSKNASPVSSPRYNYEQSVPDHQLSSDESNGIGAQNLSLHNSKNELDLSVYKSPYFRMKFDTESERKQVYVLEVSEEDGNINQENVDEAVLNGKNDEVAIERYQPPDARGKLDLDLDLRIKAYDGIENELRSRSYGNSLENDLRLKNYEFLDTLDARNKTYDMVDSEFRPERNFEPLILNPTELQGLDMSARSYHNYSNLNRYHHLYSDVERPSVDLRLNYSPPPPPYSHADILRVVSLDLTPPARHNVDLSLRTHPLHQITNTRLLSEHNNPHRMLDQSRLLSNELNTGRHVITDHTTNRLLSNDQRLLTEEPRLVADQPRLLDQNRLINDARILPPVSNGSLSPVPYTAYSVSPSPYHPTPLAPRPHATSPTPTPYHHYSAYY